MNTLHMRGAAAAVIAMVAVMGGCHDKESTGPGAAATGFQNPYNWVGQTHNDAVEAAFQYLEAHGAASRDLPSRVNMCAEGIRSHFAERRLDVPESSIESGINFGMSSRPTVLAKRLGGRSTLDSLAASGGISPRELPFVQKLRGIMRSHLASRAVAESLSVLDFQAHAALGAEQARTYLLMSATAKYSHAYWNGPGQRWMQFMKTGSTEGIFKTESVTGDSALDAYIGDVVETDYVAAGAAVVPCWLSGYAFPVCVGGAACGASTVYAIWNFPYYGKLWPPWRLTPDGTEHQESQ
jgi:hypothetical protein